MPPPAWRTLSVPVSRLREPSGPNPNVMSPEDLARLGENMREKGCLQPLLVRPLDGAMPPPLPADPLHPTAEELAAESAWLLSQSPLEVIDGSHRGVAAGAAGLSHVPVTVVQATDAQAAALRVGMNKIRGDLDLATVGQVLAGLAEVGADAADWALCGYDAEEIGDLIAAINPPDAEVEAMSALGVESEPPPPPEDDPDRRYGLDVPFRKRADRDRAKRVLKNLGGGSLEEGLLALLSEAGETE